MLFILLSIALYFLPAIVGRNKANSGAIFVLNFLLGWTIVGWIVALVWACTVEAEPVKPAVVFATVPAAIPAHGPFCSHCGRAVSSEARFCQGCGAPAGVTPATIG